MNSHPTPSLRRAMELCSHEAAIYAGPRSARLAAIMLRMGRSRETVRRNLGRIPAVARAYLSALATERGETQA